MNVNESIIKLSFFLGALAVSGSAFAQAMAEGVVRRIDLDNNKITIRHGEIKALDMPPMTMVFVAKQPAELKKVAPGDTIMFEAFEANGQYSVGKIQKK
ncbi:copper-binding protein [Zwartia vadi]|uniref:copper-binding protein n=1 Tax=Zwartia vadi TaxID=3058168 RepID=UPI0025B3F172|nr:copper-binding protein [Zwartia vadi]MDN3988573.1 copper-binding protein [Zwartia vadi]